VSVKENLKKDIEGLRVAIVQKDSKIEALELANEQNLK